MSEEEKQESQKTIVSFIAGLLIGGLLVWIFGGDSQSKEQADDTSDPTVEVNLDENQNSSDKTENNTAATSQNTTNTSTDTDEPVAETPVLQTGDGKIVVNNQPAGSVVNLTSAVFPQDEGWIGVRDYENGQLTGLLGVARFSKEQGLVPESVELLRNTESGKEYAVVFYTESGDREFSLADDVQLEDVLETFVAQ